MTVDTSKCRMTQLQATSSCKLCSEIYISGAVHTEKPLTNMALVKQSNSHATKERKPCILKEPTTNFQGICFLYFNVKSNHEIATEEETP